VAIIRSGLIAFDRIIVAVLTNPAKKPLFTAAERIEMIEELFGDDPRVEADCFDGGLLVDYARSKGVSVVLRGLRAVGDFDSELQMATMNRNLAPDVVTTFIMANDYFFVSSTLIKEVAGLGGDLTGVVPDCVQHRLRAKLGKPRETAEA
jgi:pantetheine-phosphate adenylyltransferase